MLANILVKVAGAVYSIPITNMIGGEGSGIYAVAYYIYTAVFAVSTAGIPSAISRLVAESEATGRPENSRKILRLSLLAMALLSGLLSVLVALLGRRITALVGNPAAYYALLAIAPSILFSCVAAVVRGYFQGRGNMAPTAASQVAEALGKLCFGLALTWLLMQKGFEIPIVVAGAIAGVTIGTLAGALVSICYCAVMTRRQKLCKPPRLDTAPCDSGKHILRQLAALTVPITVGACVQSVTNLADIAQVMNCLQAGGLSQQAASYLYGCYSIAVKFYTMPQVLIIAIAIPAIPAIASARAERQEKDMQLSVNTALRLTMLIALPCGIGLCILAHPILSLLYFKVPDMVDVAAPLLSITGLALIFLALTTTCNAILQALGRERLPVATMAAGLLVKLLANVFLIRLWGIYGAAVSTLLCYMVIALLDIPLILRCHIRLDWRILVVRPLLAALGMGVLARGVYMLLAGLPGAAFRLAAALLTGVFSYAVLLTLTGAFRKEDLSMLPNGKLAQLLRKFLK